MDAQLKAKWVEALRSGEYRQEHKSIGCGTKLCCIGVGGVVAGMQIDGDGWWTDGAAAAIGLTAVQRDCLIDLNDIAKKSFSEIADYIEANL